jgi:hypothetical protein
MLKRVMRSECVSCVPRVFLHAIVVYVACGTEILDVLEDIKLVKEELDLNGEEGLRYLWGLVYKHPSLAFVSTF